MPAIDDKKNLAGLTLDDVLAPKPIHTQLTHRTLFDLIRDENANKGIFNSPNNNRSWQSFRDKLILKRAGAAWTSFSPIRNPAPDIPVNNHIIRSLNNSKARRSSIRFNSMSSLGNLNPEMATNPNDSSVNACMPSDTVPVGVGKRQFNRRSSARFETNNLKRSESGRVQDSSHSPELGPVKSFKPQMFIRNSTRFPNGQEENFIDPTEPGHTRGSGSGSIGLGEERMMSAREAVAAQEAAEAEVAAELAEAQRQTVAAEPVKMSLMDLLEETDRQMGLEGSGYSMGDDDDDCEDEDEEEDVASPKGVTYSCGVCMVQHTGSAFIPCGHSFCRLCSKELEITKGNCPLCNTFLEEILDIF